MKKNLSTLLSAATVLLSLFGFSLSLFSVKEISLGERTSLFRPYITVSGTSTAQTADTVGTSTPSSVGSYRSFIDTANTAFKGFVIRGVIGQTANLLELQNGSGGILWSVGNDGAVSSTGATSTGHIVPSANNAFDIGSLSQGLAWRNLFASTSLLVSSGAASATLSSSGNLTLTGHILPASNNASDLGAFGTAFRSVYISGTLFIGASAASTTINGAGVYTTGPVTSTNKFSTGGGSEAAPAFTFNGDEDNGLFLAGTNNPAIVAAGANVLDFTGARAAFNAGITVQGGNGTVSLPTWTFINDTDVGLYIPGSNNNMLGFTVGGAERLRISTLFTSSTLPIVPSTNNTIDLGSSSSTIGAWQSIYASSSVVVGGRPATNTVDLRTAPQGVTGRGTCIALTGTDGTHYFLSVTTTPNTGTGQNLAVSTNNCMDK